MIRMPSLVVLFSLAFAAALAAPRPSEIASRDLVILPVEMPEVEETAGEAAINWSTGVLRVTGRGWGKETARTAALRRIQARSAAQNAALRNLSFALAGAPVSSDATFKEYLRRQGGKLALQAFVRGHRFVEVRPLEDGGMLATLEMPLRGRRDLAGALFAADPQKEEPPTPRLRESAGEPPQGLTPAGEEGPFTGLVVVADGLKVRPALRVWLFAEGEERLYGPGVAATDAAMEHGLATYVRSVAAASQAGIAGERPLVVRAAGLNERNGSDLILSAADAERVRAADRQARFLEKAAVAFVLPQ